MKIKIGRGTWTITGKFWVGLALLAAFSYAGGLTGAAAFLAGWSMGIKIDWREL